MITFHALEEIKKIFQTEGEITFYFGEICLATRFNKIELEGSHTSANSSRVIYFDPAEKECFFWGDFPGSDFFGTAHFKLIRSFKPTLKKSFRNLLEEVWQQKVSKTLTYTQELEKQLFG